MRRLPQVRFRVRPLLILMGLVGIAVSGYLILHRYAYRQAMRNEMSYNSEQERLYANYERQLRDEIDAFQRAKESGRAEREMTDHLFETLQSSAIAASSREVERWRRGPESPERKTIALKWAKVAADEAAYKRELHRRWRRDYERNTPPHHITDDEVKPFAMPEGWTSDDWKWGQDHRDE
jgi:hypothetical protein